MKLLYIGGSGQISFDCVHESVRAGHEVHVFNRGQHNAGLPKPPAVTYHVGDIHDDTAYRALRDQRFDVVCQFRLFGPDELRRDLGVFTGHCGRYVFISTASAYQKPPASPGPRRITEDVPLINPFWLYSRKKAEMEAILEAQDRLPYVIVRPSHTTRHGWTTAMGEGAAAVWRMLHGRPVVVPGDGTTWWTITRAEDFAPPFVKLVTAEAAEVEGRAFHLTSDHAFMWNDIYAAMGRAVGVNDADLVNVPNAALVAANPDWEGPLWGDKSWTTVFDNRAVKGVVGDFTCEADLDTIMRGIAAHHPDARSERGDEKLHALFDRLIEKQRAVR